MWLYVSGWCHMYCRLRWSEEAIIPIKLLQLLVFLAQVIIILTLQDYPVVLGT